MAIGVLSMSACLGEDPLPPDWDESVEDVSEKRVQSHCDPSCGFGFYCRHGVCQGTAMCCGINRFLCDIPGAPPTCMWNTPENIEWCETSCDWSE